MKLNKWFDRPAWRFFTLAIITVATAAVVYRAYAVVATINSPANNGYINTASVSYNLGTAGVVGTITWTRTGGTADANTPHTYTMLAADLTAGGPKNLDTGPGLANPLVSGTVYRLDITIDGETATRNNVTFDNTLPTVTSVTANNSSIKIKYSEPVNVGQAQTKTNYTVKVNGVDRPLSPGTVTATYNNTDNSVTIQGLVLNTGETVTVTINNISDLAGNVIAADTPGNAVVQDSTGPTVIGCVANGYPKDLPATPEDERVTKSQIVITFSEEVQTGGLGNPNAADNANNYVVETPVGTRVTFDSAPVYEAGRKTVTLTMFKATDGSGKDVALIDHTTFKVKVINVKDTIGNTIVDNGTTNTCTDVVSTAPYIASCTGGNTSVSVIFNEPMNVAEAGNSANYTVQSPTGAVVPINGSGYNDPTNTMTLFFNPNNYLVTGNTYQVSVINVHDKDTPTPAQAINDGVSNVCSGTVQDNIDPSVIYAAADFGDFGLVNNRESHVKVIFSEDVNTDDARSTTSYFLQYWQVAPTDGDKDDNSMPYKPPFPGMKINRVVFDEATRSSILTLDISDPFPSALTGFGTKYRIAILGIRDRVGNQCTQQIGDWSSLYTRSPDSGPFEINSTEPRRVGDGDFTPPRVTLCTAEADQVAGTTKIVINYSENVKADGSARAANTLANYSLESPTGTIIDLFDPANATNPTLGVTISYSTTDSSATITGIKDSVVKSGQSYKLTVSNVEDNAGNIIVKSGQTGGNVCQGTVRDVQPPIVTGCGVPDVTSAFVTFDESVNAADAANITNFTLEEDQTGTGNSFKTVPLSSPLQTVAYDDTQKKSTISGLNLTSLIRVTVRNVRDLSGNVIVDNLSTNRCRVEDAISPRVQIAASAVTSSAKCSGGSGTAYVDVIFTESVVADGGASAANNKANYRLESPVGTPIFDFGGAGAGVNVTYDGATKKATISGLTLIQGNTFKVIVMNVKDSAVPPNVIINDLKEGGTGNAYSGIIADAVKPVLVCTSSFVDPTTIVVPFCEDMNPTDAKNRANFILESPIGTPRALTNTSITFDYIPSSFKTIIALPSGLELTGNATYKIRVRLAKDVSGNVIDDNDTTNVCTGNVAAVDVSSPKLVCGDTNTYAPDDSHVLLTFDSPMSAATVTNKSNYAITPTLTVQQADIQSDPKSVLLTTAQQTNGLTYSVVVNGVENSNGVPIQSSNKCDFVGKDSTKPKLDSCSTPDDTHVLLDFSEPMGAGANTAANYTIPTLTVFSAAIQTAPNDDTVLLTTSRQTGGQQYTVTVSDTAGTGVMDKADNVVDSSSKSCQFIAKDTTPPSIISCVAGLKAVSLTYSEDVVADSTAKPNSATNKGNYTLLATRSSDTAASTITIAAADQDPVNPRTFILKGFDLKATTTFTVTAKNVQDTSSSANTIATGVGDSCSGTVQVLPFVLGCAASTSGVSVTYAVPMNPVQATTKANYKVFTGSSATTPVDLTNATITYNSTLAVAHISGVNLTSSYKVNVSGITSTSGLPLDPGLSDCTGFVQTNPVGIASCDTNATSVAVKFTRPVTKTDAEKLTNYALESPTGVAKAFTAVAYNDQFSIATLTVTGMGNGSTYKISAVNIGDPGGGIMPLSSCSGIVDTTALTLKSCVPHETSVQLVFSRPVREETAEARSDATKTKDDYYKLESPIGTAVSLNGTSLNYDDATKSLTISGIPWKIGSSYKMAVQSLVQDLLGASIGTTNQANECRGTVPDETKPQVLCSSSSAEDTRIIISFFDNGGISQTSAANPQNYKVEDTTSNTVVYPTGIAAKDDLVQGTYSSAAFGGNGFGQTTLTGLALTPGHTVKVTISNVSDRAGNVMDQAVCSNLLVLDSSPPAIKSCTASRSRLVAEFTEDVVDGTGPNGAENPDNYVIDHPIGATPINLKDPSINISYDPATRKTTFTFSGTGLTENQNYRIKAVANDANQNGEANAGDSGITDIQTHYSFNTGTYVVYLVPQDGSRNICIGTVDDTTPPQLSVVRANVDRVDVKFSENVRQMDAEAKVFYQLSVDAQNISLDSATFTYAADTFTTSITGLDLSAFIGGNLTVKILDSNADPVAVETIRDLAGNQLVTAPAGPNNTQTVPIGAIKISSAVAGNTSLKVKYSSEPNGGNAVDKSLFKIESGPALTNLTDVSLTSATLTYDNSALITTIAGISLTTGYTFKVTILPGFTDKNGNTMPQDSVANVATGTVLDTTRPTFTCSVNESQVKVTFIDASAMQESEVKKVDNYTLRIGNPLTPVTLSDKTVTYDATNKVASIGGLVLQPTDQYELTVSTNIADTAGNKVGGQNPCTGFVGDSMPPTVVSCSADNTSVSITFSERMKTGSPNGADQAGNYTLESPIGTSVSLSGKTVTYDTAAKKAKITGIVLTTGATAKVRAVGVQDVVGTAIIDNGSSNVCTATVIDSLKPTIKSCTVDESGVKVTFSEPVDQSDATTKSNFTLEMPPGTPVSLSASNITLAYDQSNTTTISGSGLTPVPNVDYKVTVNNVRDLASPNPHQMDETQNSCTGTVVDTISPAVTGCSTTTSSIAIIYSESVKAANTIGNYSLRDAQTGSAISLTGATATYSDSTKTATISGLSLTGGSVVEVTVNQKVEDNAKHAIDPGKNSATCLVQFSLGTKGGAGRYDLLTFPVTVALTDVDSFIAGEFDLGRFLPSLFNPNLANTQSPYVFTADSRFGLAIGEGYWAQIAESQELIITKGTPAPPDDDFIVALPTNNWFILGNPFPTTMTWDADVLQYEYAGTALPLSALRNNPSRPMEYYGWSWDSVTQEYVVVSDKDLLSTGKDYLAAGEAAWIRSYTSGVKMVIPPVSSRSASKATGGPGGSVETKASVNPSASNWTLELKAQTNELQDTGNVMGVDTSLQAEHGLRIANPPMAPLRDRFVELSFVENTFRAQGEELEVDVRDQIASRQSWNMLVTTTENNADVNLRWDNLVRVPRQYRLRLVDLTTGERRAMRTTTGYTFRSNPEGITQRRFTIELYPAAEGGIRISNLSITRPGRSALGGARITYLLSRPGDVEVRVLNSSGRLVRRLGPGSASAGLNSAVWDGRGNRGEFVPRGVYLIQVSVRDEEGQAFQAVRTLTVR